VASVSALIASIDNALVRDRSGGMPRLHGEPNVLADAQRPETDW